MAHNNYFQFKQFRINQNRAAMRVGTDGILLGAWTRLNSVQTILDVGTGTGLVALMLAQRTDNDQITGIDIDEDATADAIENVQNSPWRNRIQIHQTSVQEFTKNAPTRFDLIVSNPPFFNNAPQATHAGRNAARHTQLLSHTELLASVAKLLAPQGQFSVVLPTSEAPSFRNIAADFRLFPKRITWVKPNPAKPIKRVLLELTFEGEIEEEQTLTLETEHHHQYTPEFTMLVHPFYLNL
jgi:tRNA1Val (adenine37-N6)-methyltransferase